MYESLRQNVFIVRADPERKAAHRQEIKRALAEISVKKTRRDELQNIIAKLQSDSDRAAEVHSKATAVLQSELDRLDAEQVECVLASKATPEKSVKRRREILNELAELNQKLETTIEANKRAAQPIEQQVNTLTFELVEESSLQSQLVALCSDKTRHEMQANEMRMQLGSSGIKEMNRRIGILTHNVTVSKAEHNPREASIQQMKLDDAKALLAALNHDVAMTHTRAAELRAQAMAE